MLLPTSAELPNNSPSSTMQTGQTTMILYSMGDKADDILRSTEDEQAKYAVVKEHFNSDFVRILYLRRPNLHA